MDKKWQYKTQVHVFRLLGLLSVSCVFLFHSCKKNEVKNPYDEIVPVVNNDNPDIDDIPEGSFAWLHAKVFKPTCANSGCHDGTFEPEFRSIGSAYNSLVNHPTISNSLTGQFEYRVTPGNANTSYLHHRMTVDESFNSGMMPAAVDDGSDWDQRKDEYIAKIRAWINEGARDMYGSPAPAATSNTPPMVLGMVVFPHDNTTNPFPREQNPLYGIGAIEVPAQLVDVWILPFDDTAYPDEFPGISLMASTSTLDFSSALQSSFSLNSPIMAMPFGSQSPEQFYYKATIDLSSATPGDYYYLRNYINDGFQSGLTEVPNNDSQPFWFLIFSLKIV